MLLVGPTGPLTPQTSATTTRRTRKSLEKVPTFQRLFNFWLVLILVVGLAGWQGWALRMINLDVPETAIQGETHKLSCSFSLQSAAGDKLASRRQQTVNLFDRKTKRTWPQSDKYQQQVAEGNDVDEHDNDHHEHHHQQQHQQDELLYAIKWYKDEREFFRYLAQEWPHKQVLPLDGLHVDVERSDNQTVVLRDVSLKTSGSFRCEVSTDAPTFVTKSIERKMHIFVLPSEGPSIERLQQPSRQHNGKPFRVQHLGDQLELRCSSRESKPAAKLDWIINDTLNLSTLSAPLTRTGEPIFKSNNKRLVRLPAQTQTSDAAPNTQQSSSAYQIFELDNHNAHIGGQPMGPVISMVDVLVDQLMEISTSSLNFTVDSSLIQFLSNGSPSAKGSSSPIASQTTAALMSSNPGRKQSSKSAQGNGAQVKWTKSGASSGARPAINAELTLKIKCVARILHLTMSDEIKLRLVNRTRESVVNDNSTSRAGSQQQRKQNIGNSGMTDTPQALIIVGLTAFTTSLMSRVWSV